MKWYLTILLHSIGCMLTIPFVWFLWCGDPGGGNGRGYTRVETRKLNPVWQIMRPCIFLFVKNEPPFLLSYKWKAMYSFRSIQEVFFYKLRANPTGTIKLVSKIAYWKIQDLLYYLISFDFRIYCITWFLLISWRWHSIYLFTEHSVERVPWEWNVQPFLMG